jgi:dihydroorotate dehydrogenase (fumarate)
MDLSTEYLGLRLKNPIVASSGPFTERADTMKELEDAGAAAVVMHSLFEEQITRETYELQHHLTQGTDSFAESLTYFPEADDFTVGPEKYLKQIQETKKSVKIPVIASLNGHSMGGWTSHAKMMQEAGADAIELNIYFLPTESDISGQKVEDTYIEILKNVKASVKIPVAVKLSPFFSSVANMAKKLDDAGADGLVLFNRFYQPDFDLENLEVVPNVILSTPMAMRLPLRWIAILHKRVNVSLAATSGIHNDNDVIKMLLAGADATMMCSALLKHGIKHITQVIANMVTWMEEHEYQSVKQLKGSMSQKSVDNPTAFERANYMKAITSWTADKLNKS